MKLKLLLAAALFVPAAALAQTTMGTNPTGAPPSAAVPSGGTPERVSTPTPSSGAIASGNQSSMPSGDMMMSNSTAKLSMVDAHFVKTAAIAGLAEVSDGKLAEQMGATDAVKNIGTQMVTDHRKANDQLMSLAQHKGAMVPTGVDSTHAAMSAKLQSLSGAAFDKQYLHTEYMGHVKTIALFKTEASTGSDPDLKSFAATTLPTLKQHLAMIQAAMK